MPDTLTTITKLINSPPGQLAAGGVLAGIVWKFFERVEAVLTDQTKSEIARWIRVRSLETAIIADDVENWPETFARVFDRVFGRDRLSLTCFGRSCIASLSIALLTVFITANLYPPHATEPRLAPVSGSLVTFIVVVFSINLIPDYVALLKTRRLLTWMAKRHRFIERTGVLVLDSVLSLGLASATFVVGLMVAASMKPYRVSRLTVFRDYSTEELWTAFLSRSAWQTRYAWLWFYPIFFSSIWLWLYAGSGFLLKTVPRFDFGFDWFNRKFDIDKKPLQSIGLVAGMLVALAYWAAVIVSRVL
jgi:hypothetical protein